jgi:hypothetical protein
MVQSFGEMLRNFWDPLFAALDEPEDSGSDMKYVRVK